MTRPWKRALVRVSASAGLLIASVIPLGDLSGAFAALASTLGDPFGLIAARSPGARGDGALQSTKPDRVAALPHERVLSQVRDREPPAYDIPDSGMSGIMVPDLPDLSPAANGGASGSPFTVASAPAFSAPFTLFNPFSPFAAPPVTTSPGGDGGVPGGTPGSGAGSDPVTNPGAGTLPGTPDVPGDLSGDPVVGELVPPPVIVPVLAPVIPPDDALVPPLPPTLPTLGPGADPDLGPPAILPVPPGLPSDLPTDLPPGPPFVPPPDAPGPLSVPEAPSAAMMLLGLVAAAAMRRRVRRLS